MRVDGYNPPEPTNLARLAGAAPISMHQNPLLRREQTAIYAPAQVQYVRPLERARQNSPLGL
jgi:hypothetical protein